MKLPNKKLLTILIPSVSAFIIIVVMMILAFVPVASKTETIEASCEENGGVYKSSLFGYKYKVEDIPALGHDVVPIASAKEPTCTKMGSTSGSKCSRCGKVFEDITSIPMVDHIFKNGKCVQCGKTYTESVNNIEFTLNGSNESSLDYLLFGGNISTLLTINGTPYKESQSPFGVSFEFVESDIDATIENGELHIGDVLGTIHLKVTVQGANVITKTVSINVNCVDNAELLSIVALAKTTTKSYIEGETFNPDDIRVWGNLAVDNQQKLVRILNFKYEKIALIPSVSEIEITYGDARVAYPISVLPKTLQSIEISEEASNKDYIEGQYFDPAGLKIKANYEFITRSVSDFVVETESYLKEGDKFVRIAYTANGVTKYVEHSVNVGPKKLTDLQLDDENVQKEYTIGDYFNPDGLVVKATFDYIGEMVVTDYSYNKESLSSETTEIVISYTVANVALEKTIGIVVKEPYQQLCSIKVLTPADVSISWLYKYRQNGEGVSDNTKYKDNNLLYDKTNGLYEVPVGAIVTATVRNPAMIDIAINGKNSAMNYVEKAISWKIKSHNSIEISLIEMSGTHSVIRFTGDEKDQFFLYEGFWNGQLIEDNLLRLNAIYNDNEIYYYSYLINGRTLRYDELNDEYFVKNSIISVAKNAITEDAKNVVLHLNDAIAYTIRIPVNEAEAWIIPSFEQPGFYFRGWAIEGASSPLSQEDVAELLQSDEDTVELFVVWEEEIVDYSNAYLHRDINELIVAEEKVDDDDIAVCGEWHAEDSIEDESIACTLTLNANGSFEYSIQYNDVLNCEYQGKYRISGNSISVIQSEPVIDEIPYLNGVDFGIVIGENGIECNLIVVDNEEVVFGSCQLEKR